MACDQFGERRDGLRVVRLAANEPSLDEGSLPGADDQIAQATILFGLYLRPPAAGSLNISLQLKELADQHAHWLRSNNRNGVVS